MLRTFVLLLVMMSFAATGQGGDTTKTSRGAAQALHATGEVSSAQSPEVSNGEPGTGGSGLSDEWKSQALGRGTVDGTATGPSRSDGPAPGQAVTASPMTLAAMGLGVEYERALGDLVAIFASLEGSLLWRGMGGQAGARFYPCGRPMNGVFLDAHGSAFRGQFSGEPYTQFGGGMLVGRSWTLEHGVLLSLGGGADVKQTEMERGGLSPSCVSAVCYDQALNAPAQPNGLRLTPSVRAAIGYAF